MDKERFETFLDFGSSKIRIGVFDIENRGSHFFSDEKCNNNFKINKFSLSDSDSKVNKLIKSLEKKTNIHLNKINLMLDTPDFLIINIAKKSKFEGRLICINDIKYLIQELNLLIKNNYSHLKIIHLIVTKIIIDGKEFNSFLDDNIHCNELIIEVMFICLPNIIIQQITEKF